jgi:hypothetical protein
MPTVFYNDPKPWFSGSSGQVLHFDVKGNQPSAKDPVPNVHLFLQDHLKQYFDLVSLK